MADVIFIVFGQHWRSIEQTIGWQTDKMSRENALCFSVCLVIDEKMLNLEK